MISFDTLKLVLCCPFCLQQIEMSKSYGNRCLNHLSYSVNYFPGQSIIFTGYYNAKIIAHNYLISLNNNYSQISDYNTGKILRKFVPALILSPEELLSKMDLLLNF